MKTLRNILVAAISVLSACGSVATSSFDAPPGVCMQELCNGQCVDTATDPQHCGGCDLACPGATTCSTGDCVCDQLPPVELCTDGVGNSSCVDTGTDPQNCGGCGIPCGPGQACDGGQCTRYHLFFTTSAVTRGAMGSLAGADATCATAGDNAGLGSNFVAVLYDGANARMRSLNIVSSVVNVNGDVIIVDGMDFLGGTSATANAVAVSETGGTPGSTLVWIGGPNGTCLEWSTAASNFNAEQVSSTAGNFLATALTDSCDTALSVYCISQ